jgi:cytoskeletal protein CcmA (bactofilin family)
MWFDTMTGSDAEDVRVVGPTHRESVDCRTFRAKGATSVDGDVRADVATLKGTASVGGDVSVREFTSKGATDVAGGLEAEEVSLKGTARVVGSLRTDALSAKGSSQFGDVAADSFAAKGQVAVDTVTADDIAVHGVVSAERLEATTVSLVLSGDTSTVGALVGSDVTVERDDQGDQRGDLEATTIEGETVAIEHAEVEEVVGREVSVGPGSHVGLVRVDELDVHPDATVERTERLD